MKRLILVLVVVALVMGVMAAPAGATKGDPGERLPFSGVASGQGSFNFDPDAVAARCLSPAPPFAFAIATFSGSGHAKHLGRIDMVAEHCSHSDFTYSQGILTITAANGDVLVATYTNGASDLSTFPDIGFTDDFTFVDGGTGRFAEASGGGVEAGVADFNTDEFVVSMEGVISYDASNRRRR